MWMRATMFAAASASSRPVTMVKAPWSVPGLLTGSLTNRRSSTAHDAEFEVSALTAVVPVPDLRRCR